LTYSYLLEKIRAAPLLPAPFAHIHITDFFSAPDFAMITAAPEIAVHNIPSDAQLLEALFAKGYEIINFPGCIQDQAQYLGWHRHRGLINTVTNTACEGFGMTLRLKAPQSPAIAGLNQFLNSRELQATLAEKFHLNLAEISYDAGIQKYLDGYEISPHPDIRQKALTFMVNINPAADSPALDHHTHYLKFRPDHDHVRLFWENNPGLDRCWVPWSWCDTQKIQRENNSIVIFSPGNTTMHGVKTNYDHLQSQRTQLYGNFWRRRKTAKGPEWEDFLPARRHRLKAAALKGWLVSAVT
jgi:hypothetical protein